ARALPPAAESRVVHDFQRRGPRIVGNRCRGIWLGSAGNCGALMKYIISVDAEGLACVVGAPGGTLNDAKENYEFARKQGAREADAAARALFDSGATEVVIIDAHGSGVNYHYDLIDKRCDIQLGSGAATRLPAVTEGSAGFLLV